MGLDTAKLSPCLFWDVRQDSVVWDTHRVWLLQRILERGTWEDWLAVAAAISVTEMEELAPKLKLAARERNFLNNWMSRDDAH